MPRLHLLGTGAALSEPHRTTSMLAISCKENLFLVDCGGDVVQRAFAAGLDLSRLTGMIITHEHPDHVSGFPLFMEKIWLAGRRAPLPIYGPPEALDQARRSFDTYDTSRWEGLPKRAWRPITDTLWDDDRWRITALPVQHGVPTVGLRFESKETGGVIGYSSDTNPCDSVIELGRNADILVHEATGDFPGHSTAIEAAEIAHRAGAKRLLLIHLPANLSTDDLKAAQNFFPKTEWGEELGGYDF